MHTAASHDVDYRLILFNHYPLESAQSVPLNESGRVMKIVMAAKFYHSIHSGWPILQIRRRINNSLVVVDMAMSEPKSLGYLNVFEYDMSTDIQAGDILRIRGSPVTESRYLLAYLNHNGVYKPLLHISVSNLSREVTSDTTLAIGNGTTIPQATIMYLQSVLQLRTKLMSF